jgi:two-component system sensor histidine kinase HydH
MDARRAAGYFVASIALLIALVAVHAVSAVRRTQAEVSAQMTAKATALADAIEASSANAIRSNALVEEMIAQRLTDNARLIDELLRRPLPPGEVERVAAANGLRRIDLLDRDGKPWTPPPAGPPMPGMLGPPAPGDFPAMMSRHRMGHFMWGRRWGPPPEPEATASPPSAVRDRRFWDGSVFGVAVGATSFPGIIAVHAGAEFVRDFQREIGVEHQIQTVARQAGVTSVALLAPDLTVLAHSDGAVVGQREADPELAGAVRDGRVVARRVARADGSEVLEVARPLSLERGRVGLLAIALSTEPLERARRDGVRAAVTLGGAIILAGVAGMALIFYLQQRHLGERRRLEADMVRRERLAALGDVAAAFAHEVRNPLNAVSMGLQRLRAEFTPEPAAEYTRFVDLMQSELRRLNSIVEQFIGLARPLPLKPAPLALDELLADVQALVDAEARRSGVAVRVETAAGLPAITADRDHLRQVVLNLVLNAVQAMRQGGGSVTLGATATRDGAALTVADTGPGIAPDVLPRIFDPYFTTRRDGLGLGLTISRRIVEAHGGALAALSRPGRTVFRVTLPRTPA